MSTTTATAYQINPAGIENRLRAAYAPAGKPLPDVLRHVEDALRAEPGARDLAAELTEAAVGTDDAAAWLEDAVARMTRALAVDALRAEAARHRDAVVKRHTATIAAQAATDLAPTFDKAADTLRKAAPKLPQHAPLDLSAVYDADATKEHRATVEALTVLGRLASVHTVRTGDRVSMDLARLLLVVEVPEVTHAQPIDRLTRTPLEPADPARTAVIELERCARDHGADVALVRVARGDWPALALSLARDGRDIARRLEHARAATSVVVSEAPRRTRTGTAPTVVRL